ncbi:MAG: 2Fe-2S iron-sulfur cluster-binding protein [Thermodesulfobacteriota bacterium]
MSDGDAGNGKFQKPVKVVIDGREIVAEAGHPLLQVALDNGIEIPHYCYHPKLSIDGSCRMCQVKIEKAPKLAIACNTPVADGMVVDTQAPEVAFARRGVMELLLINHPLDCPICDQAGECYLQDYSFGYGRQDSRATSPRRKGIKRHPIGPRVIFDQERCILCRRCVRFTKEISKTDELRVFGIGDRSRIGTAADQPLDNDYSINTADICPVGALLSRDFHHKRRVWFLEEHESVCPSCSNGCNVKLGIYRNEIQRLLPRRNDDVNDTWMCDHGRLNYGFVHDETRVRVPLVRGVKAPGPADVPAAGNGASTDAAYASTLEAALAAAGERIRAALETHGPGAIAVIGSPRLPNEECHRLVQLVRALKTPHFDMVVPVGPSDDFLIKPEKAANARGARDVGVAPGAGGKDVRAILEAIAAGEIELLLVVGSDDLATVIGDGPLRDALAKLDALIVVDANRSEITDLATVVLPGLTWAEKDGTFTNHAGRVQRIRKAVEPPPGLVTDGALFMRLEQLVQSGADKPVTFDPAATLEEIGASVPVYAGMSFATVGSLGRPTQQPAAAAAAEAPVVQA